MSRKTVEFQANGHTASGYLALPPWGPGRALVLIQEYWGLVPHIIDLAERFALSGYVTLAPDLYHGQVAKSPDEAGKLYMALKIAEAAKEMRGAAEFLLTHPKVTSKKAGIVGFCMGGALALYAGMEHPDRFAAVVDFYGAHPSVTIDPAKVRVPVQGHFGKKDKSVPEAEVAALATAVRKNGGAFEAHWYDAGHAFFNDARPQVFSKTDADLSWSRTLAFLGEHVK